MKIYSFTKNPVGRKLIMAFTGSFLILFVLLHFLGNSTIFFGPEGINVYTEKLHSLPLLVWLFRLLMILFFCFHIYFGITLYFENKSARPTEYRVKKSLKADFASKNMFWTGCVIIAFLTYHLLHFTFRVLSDTPLGSDIFNRPDIYSMVITGLKEISSLIIYAIGLFALFLHLFHGIQSLFQTVSLSTEKSQPFIIKASKTIAFIIFIGYLSIPAVILTGVLR